ncbi:IS630 family transposase, partial [Arthrospira platensis SPKY1]|nr:IS630 family transposase [Arthrospira platensis SPKY1]
LQREAVRVFLHRLGLSVRKVGMMPAKADPQVQEVFKKKELEPRLKQAQAGERAVFFVDAAHFVLAPFLGFFWCFTRWLIRAPSGRQRYNVLGALNAITHQLVTVTNTTYINAQSVCELLDRLKALALDVPITLIMDNARYQRCQLVMDHAKTLGIELLFLPPYSPNLNIIERLWKFVRTQCLYCKYYNTFSEFSSAIQACLDQTHSTHKKALQSLLTLKFQTLKNSKVMGG